MSDSWIRTRLRRSRNRAATADQARPGMSRLKLRPPGCQKWNCWKMMNSLIEKGLQVNKHVSCCPARTIAHPEHSLESRLSLRVHRPRSRTTTGPQVDSMAAGRTANATRLGWKGSGRIWQTAKWSQNRSVKADHEMRRTSVRIV
jgi:hypothetical protein